MQKHKLYYALTVVLGLVIFYLSYGFEIVNPANTGWLMDARHDWGTHYLGWAFYRGEGWTFPLGNIESYCYPAGTNVGFTDSIPLLAVFFKLFSFALPENFQYFGMWLLFCHLAAAHYTLKIFSLYKLKGIYGIIAVLFIAYNPIIYYRMLHPALCAHWLIIASFYYYLRPANADNVYSINKGQISIILLSSLINPYMWLMVLGFGIILPLKHWKFDRLIPLKKFISYAAVSVLGSLVLWFIIGMIGFNGETNLAVKNGYGLYAFNLNCFFNGGGFSRFLPELPWVSPMQYEGYLYLGMGLIILIVLVAIYLIATRRLMTVLRRKDLLPLYLLVAAVTLFAITNKVTYGDKVLFEVPLPDFLLKLGGTFRASGRFIWILYYFIFISALVLFMRSKFPDWAKASVLTALVALQFYDTKAIYVMRDPKPGTYDIPLDEAKWNAIIPAFDRMVTYPPFNNHLLNQMDYQDLSYLAMENRKAISLGYSAREPYKLYKAYTDSLTAAIDSDALSDNEIYITTPQYIGSFGAILRNKNFEIDYIDGYYLLYAKSRLKAGATHKSADAVKKIDSLQNIYNRSNFIKVIEKPAILDNKIKMNIEEIVVKERNFRIKGWAFLNGKSNNKGDSIFVTVTSGNKTHIARTGQVKRPDIIQAFSKENLESSGFNASVFTEGLENSDYVIGLAIKDASGNWTFAGLGGMGEVKKKVTPVPLAKLPPMNGQMGNIDGFDVSDTEVTLGGWTAFKDAHSDDNEIKVVIMLKEHKFAIETKIVLRPDVTAAYNNKFRYDMAGFNVKLDKSVLEKGDYKVGVLLRNLKTGRESFMETDKTFTIK
ncbi:DUF6311 domain-containing protein [Flavobacterium sp. MFBS3-15]|uniref:DUF6311 domain-containing protein n=1 Tax=Flavobacterium sp. MFBS3-15 TaxID=2989816 RepID=UPI0022357B9B|nr:DUF6311 domain-containing protein [Flavobacterium sp. MFBS3-15]MCW4469150.1 DUF6311 domain-containing protein [Flavobacterium sp. MFBS3-15]